MSKSKTIKGMMRGSIVMFCIIPIMLMWISFAIASYRIVNQNSIIEQSGITNTIAFSVEQYLMSINEALTSIASDTETQRLLHEVNRTEYNSTLYNAYQHIAKSVGLNCSFKPGYMGVLVSNIDDGFYWDVSIPKLLREQLCDKKKISQVLHENKGQPSISPWINPNNQEELFVISKPVFNFELSRFVGITYFVGNSNIFSTLFDKSLSDRSSIILENNKGQRIFECQYSAKESLLPLPSLNDFHERDLVKTNADINQYHLSLRRNVHISKYITQILITQFVIFVIMMTIAVLIWITIKYIYKRINSDLSLLLTKEKSTIADDVKYFEFRQVSDEFLSLAQKSDEEEKEISELNERCDSITLDKLQAQINPHFLYNTLTSVKYIALENNQKEIGMLITALVKLLKSTINRDGIYITVREEIENAKNYMYIQKLVYNNNFSVEYSICDKLLEMKVPNFILQPLLENSIFHGIHPETLGGIIKIDGVLQDDNIFLTVSDNGDGFKDATINDILYSSDIKNKAQLTNIGLRGVNQKIRIMCGNGYGISIKSQPMVGSVTEIKLPANFNE